MSYYCDLKLLQKGMDIVDNRIMSCPRVRKAMLTEQHMLRLTNKYRRSQIGLGIQCTTRKKTPQAG